MTYKKWRQYRNAINTASSGLIDMERGVLSENIEVFLDQVKRHGRIE
jgi:hypothetical protein